MAHLDLRIAIVNLFVMAVNRQETDREPDFVSRQVAESRRYYLDLNPNKTKSLIVVCGGVERMRPDYVVSRTDFPYYAIEVVTEGQGRLTLSDQRWPLSSGMLFAYGPKRSHRIENRGSARMRKYYVDFAGREARGALQRLGLLDDQPIRITAIHEVVEVFEAMHREAQSDSALSHDICATLLKLLLLKIEQRSVSGATRLPRSFETYERIRRHIEEHFLDLRTIEAVARECHVTPIYLSRLFRRFSDLGAYDFLLRKRMNYAASLLLEEGVLVKQVAERLGFADAFQFTRAFKRVYGIPPKKLIEFRTRQSAG